jgi:drug/metabolite transporter (DMT)-like permease
MRFSKSGGAGLALGAGSAATFGSSGALGSSLLDAGWSPGGAVTVRILVAAAVLTGPALWQLRGRWSLLRRHGHTVAAYGLLAVAGCQLCYFNAVAHLTVGVALLLEYLGTILVVGWLWLRRGQAPRTLTVTGGCLAVIGLLLVLDLTGSQHISLLGVGWGLGAAVGLALYFLLSASDDQPLPPLVVAWGGMLVGGVALVALAAVGVLRVRTPLVDVTLVDHRVSWVVPVLGLSLVAAVVAYVAGIGAARLLGAKVASFVGLTEVVFAVLFAWVLLHQVPGTEQFVGGVLILGGIILVRADELTAKKPLTSPSGPVTDPRDPPDARTGSPEPGHSRAR